jgi:hypothetical protein
LLAHDAQGRPVPAAELAALDRNAPLFPSARGLRLAVDALWYLAHWTADRDLPKRFDVPFFVARMPEGQSLWPTIRAVRAHLGAPSKRWSATAPAAFMIFPPSARCSGLRRFAGTDAVFAALQASSRCGRLPARRLLNGKEARHMEDEALRRAGNGLPDGQIPRWTGRASAPCRCARTCCA